jgi:rhodanese-related sulfurtransferase
MDLKRIISEACVLIAISALFGLTLNYQLVLDAFSGQLAPQRQVEQEQTATLLPLPVMLEEVQQVLADGGVVVDARSPELFADGHIEGASSLPLVEIDAVLAEFLERVPKEQTIVAYCSGFGCPDSFDLGVVLIEEGYMDVRVFEGGYPEWRDAGLPIGGAGR